MGCWSSLLHHKGWSSGHERLFPLMTCADMLSCMDFHVLECVPCMSVILALLFSQNEILCQISAQYRLQESSLFSMQTPLRSPLCSLPSSERIKLSNPFSVSPTLSGDLVLLSPKLDREQPLLPVHGAQSWQQQ